VPRGHRPPTERPRQARTARQRWYHRSSEAPSSSRPSEPWPERPSEPEQELERLRQVVDRLTDANQEALEVIERMLVREGEGGFVDDEAETAWEAEHLEATLVDVRDILGGASEDVRGLLDSSGE
jgi:hypothetical protein